MKDILRELGIVGVKVLLFLAGTFACFSMLTGAFVVLTQMTFWNSICVAAIPSLAFGIWCQHLKKSDLKEES